MRQRHPWRSIGADEAESVVRRQDALMLDVRDADSFRKAHIDGAQHLSTTNLSAVISGTPKRRPILIYCYHGNASREFAQTFSDFGFVEVYSLDGGYTAWSNRPRPQDHPMPDDIVRDWLAAQGFPPGGVNAVIANGTTPLMKASHQGQGAIVRRLTAAGAQLDARNADGNNALWLACVGGHLEVIDILVAVRNRHRQSKRQWRYTADVCRFIRQGRGGRAPARQGRRYRAGNAGRIYRPRPGVHGRMSRAASPREPRRE